MELNQCARFELACFVAVTTLQVKAIGFVIQVEVTYFPSFDFATTARAAI